MAAEIDKLRSELHAARSEFHAARSERVDGDVAREAGAFVRGERNEDFYIKGQPYSTASRRSSPTSTIFPALDARFAAGPE
jgi:hypothetical protein